MRNWTKEQNQVINLRGKNMLVSAAAGSGKTAVLIERILSMVLDDHVDVDRMLIVTFTNAAAAEMRDRLRTSLEEAHKRDPEDPNILRQMTLIHNAHIETIHSFCLNVVRNHFHRIDLDPGFRVADEGEMQLMREDVCADVMESYYAEQNPDFLLLADNYSSARNDDALRGMILKLYYFAVSYPWPEEWLDHCADASDCKNAEDLNHSDWMKEYLHFFSEQTGGMIELEKKMAAQIQQPGGPSFYEEAVASDLAQLQTMVSLQTYEEWQKALSQFSFTAFKRAKKSDDYDKELRDTIKEERQLIRNTINKKWKPMFEKPLDEICSVLQESSKMLRILARVTKRFLQAFQKRKQENHVIDFSDMEHFALQILLEGEDHHPSEAALEYRRQFEQVLVDEYQDSNYVQETILKAVSRAGGDNYEKDSRNNLFMVGDVKQSIYRFRLARPELFLEKFRTYPDRADCARIDLHKNFRSREEVLYVTNEIFSRLMHKEIGGVEYDRDAALYAGRNSSEDAPGSYGAELLLVDADSASEAAEKEAHATAARIRAMVEQEEIKDISYSDIVILMRSPKSWAPIYQNVFSDEGIPLVVDSSTGYFSAAEVQTILGYLKLIDNPLQDIVMASSLRSYFGGFNESDMAEVRETFPNENFAEAVFSYAGKKDTGEKTFDEALAERLQNFIDQLNRYRERVPYTPIHTLLRDIMNETGYYLYQAALPAGQRRKANLDMLLEKAAHYEETSYQGLMHFNRYIEKLHKYEVDFGEAESAGARENAVRLISIHKSKGLEYPVVFVSQLGKKLNSGNASNDLARDLELHPEYGAGLRYRDRKRHIKSDTLFCKALNNMEKKEELGEEMRILYVAMTRAQKKLILSGTYHLDGKQPGTGLDVMSRMSAGSALGWILPCVQEMSGGISVRYWTEKDQEEEDIRHSHVISQQEAQTYEKAYEADEQLIDQIDRSFSWKYPYADLVLKRQKVSVSELKHAAMEKNRKAVSEIDESSLFPEEVPVPYVPRFMEKTKENEGALYGTAMHRILECLDFKLLPPSGETKKLQVYLDGQIRQMLEDGRIDKDINARISRKKLLHFLGSGCAQRMKTAAGKHLLYREQLFVMSIDAHRAGMENGNGDILTQGIIDVFWKEGNRIILMDYKTDRVQSGEELLMRYRTQLELYKEALKRRYPDLTVSEVLIYSFSLDRFFTVSDPA